MALRDLLFAKAGGGGNPNRAETVTGTLENPIAGLSASPFALKSAFSSGNASGKITLDASALGLGEYTYPFFKDGDYFTISLSSITADSVFDSNALWEIDASENVVLDQAYMAEGETGTPSLTITDLMSYAALIPTETTIYWHPMPDSNSD